MVFKTLSFGLFAVLFVIIIMIVYVSHRHPLSSLAMYPYICILLNNIPGSILTFGFDKYTHTILLETGMFNKNIQTILTTKMTMIPQYFHGKSKLQFATPFTETKIPFLLKSAMYQVNKSNSDKKWNALLKNLKTSYYGLCIVLEEPTLRTFKTIYKMRKRASVIMFVRHKLNFFYSKKVNNMINSFKYTHIRSRGSNEIFVLSNYINPNKLFESYGL